MLGTTVLLLINSNLIPVSLVITKGLQDLRALQTENYPIICLLLTLERERRGVTEIKTALISQTSNILLAEIERERDMGVYSIKKS